MHSISMMTERFDLEEYSLFLIALKEALRDVMKGVLADLNSMVSIFITIALYIQI